jgi:hypothetical protein
MKVQDLIDKLSELDHSLPVVCSLELNDTSTTNVGVNALEVDAVTAIRAVRSRDSSGKACLLFQDLPEAETLAVIEVTNDI